MADKIIGAPYHLAGRFGKNQSCAPSSPIIALTLDSYGITLDSYGINVPGKHWVENGLWFYPPRVASNIMAVIIEKMCMRHFISTLSALFALAVASYPQPGHAANLTTTTTVGASTGWNTASIWKTNGTGTAVTGVFPGNTYECIDKGTPFGNNLGNTRMRNLYAATDPAFQTFPGDSLTLNTNTEFRFKRIGSSSGAIPTVNFPGVGGSPGLILNGGVFNAGDDATFPITGTIYVPTLGIICPGDNGAGPTARTARALDIAGQLSGSGTMVIFQTPTNLAQRISGTNNTFTGQWIVKAGRLLGAVADSLGTNNITIDPMYEPPLDPTVLAANTFFQGPAVLELGYDLNSAGSLILINGGTLRLHQNCVFSSVSIEGTPLSAGTHYFAELLANYPNNIEAGGSGSITVQPYGPAPLLIITQPGPQQLYAGRTGHFTATISGTSPITYQWLKNGVPLADGGNISGTTNTTLTISNVAAGDAANYSLRATNVRGTTTSTAVALSLVTLAETYESAVVAANPAAFYQLNETSDPAVIAQAWDYVGGYNGTYGTAVQNGNPTYNIAGPLPVAGFPGFAAGNKAAQFVNGTLDARVTVAPWNLNTNTVTITAWINPTGTQYPYNGIVFCRGGGTVAGLNYSPGVDASGNYTLGYTWNNDWETYNWDSTLVAPPGQWSLVALVVTPTNATIHVMNTNGLVASSHPWNHVVQAFGGTTLIGDDSNASNGTRVFNGTIDDVAIFNSALSPSQIVALYSAASGISSFAPAIGGQPLSQTLYAGQTAQFVVAGGGTEPVSYRWQMSPSGAGTFSDLTDGGKISGATTPTLIISNLAEANTADYRARIFSSLGTTNSSAASLTVLPTFPSENITLSVQQATGTDWDTGADWSDGQAASLSAVMKPGSTYEVLAGARLRSPQSPRMAVFPGDQLTLDGDAIRNVDPAAGATISEIRFKQPNPGTVIFKKLVMNGGQLDAGNDGVVVIGGEINVLTNAPFNNDSGNDRGYRIDAKLTGSGNIEYYGYNQTAFVPAYVNNLNIAGANNTFSGKWNVVSGTLLGTGPNALGTNDIVIGANGAWETTYDINNPNGSLLLNGRMYLHQNDTFRSVLIGGVAIAPGTYTFSQLSTTYTNNFPVSWTPQTGATNFSTGSGSLTVLGFAPPTFVTQPLAQTLYVGQTAQFTVSALGGQPLSYRWQMGATSLSDGGRISGSTTTNLTITNLVQGDSADYVVVIANSAGSVTSSVARLTVQPTGPPMNITISAQQPTGSDWDTAADWSDGLAASVSALVKPGSTYEVLPGARLRTPAGAAAATFPGDMLTVDGDGLWVNNSGATIGEIRLKHATGGTVRFNKLVMNGGQLDSASDGNGNVVIVGEMNILANTPLYNDSGNDRGFQIDAWLTGNGSIEYHAYTGAAFNPGYVYNLNITGTSNTFSGQWNVVQGVLLGSGANSLGTNDITIGANAALETTYDIYNPQGKLVLDGQMFLHQNDSFHDAIIGGVPLAPGTHTFAQLAAAYPANFPVSWTLQTGSTVSTGSGSIAVGVTTPPVKPPTMTFSRQGPTLTLGWPTEAIGFKLQSTPVLPATPWQDVAGSETTNSVSVTIGAGNQYFRLKK